MCIKSNLPVFGFFAGFIQFYQLKNLHKMRSDGIVKRTVLWADLNVGIPAFKRQCFILITKVKLLESLCDLVRISFGKVFADLTEKDFYSAGCPVLWVFALHILVAIVLNNLSVCKRYQLVRGIFFELCFFI